MKKLFTLICVILFTFSISAQQFGIKAGLNIAAIGASDDEWFDDQDARTGFHFGGIAMFLNAHNLYYKIICIHGMSDTSLDPRYKMFILRMFNVFQPQ